jgi:pimeloyl-ACP methyl ester carboxylesterase
VVVSSLATGLAAVLVLVLVVVAGAREHVITGAALLGCAAGWAALAVLSARLTTRPQRWASVPAAVLGGTGLGLLVLAPGDGALTAAGWGWPPALLALAVWTGSRVRRHVPAGSGRWPLYGVVAVMTLAAVGGAVETVTLAVQATPAPGRTIDVGGHRLHLDCTGTGSPTVVLQSGLGETSPSWARIAPAVSGTTRVCAYDRAGQGWSEDSPNPPDGVQAAADLHALLDRAGERGPYVLVGHSTGGSYAMSYAARHPEQVAGMVLLDGADLYRSPAPTAPGGADAPAAFAVLPGLARLGVGQLLPRSFWSSLPEPAAAQVQAFNTSPRSWRNVRDESAAMPALFTQARALTSLGSTPLVVLTAAGHDADPGWAVAQDRMAALSANSSHRHADASHAALLDEEGGAAASVRAVADVVRAVRAGTPLPPG